MASTDEDLCTSHADFAVICSFIDKFGEKLGLPLPNIGELQNFLEDTDNVNPLLSQGVCLLLRRINKSVKFDRWERGLQRFAHSYSHQDGWELERFGFKKAKLEVKIRVFKNLLEAQFDLYKSFKDKVNLLGASELRLQPCGRDKKGVSYWCQLDDCANLRIYCDDQDEETWTLVASTREELVALIAELDSESPPGASREMSVDGSRSGTVTPMGLSEAPTPVDSKAATPVASGRTSPVIDTGQTKDDSIKKIKSEVVEKVKERLKVEETEDVPKSGEKLEGTVIKKKEDMESKMPSKLIENKEENLKDKKGSPDSGETKAHAERGKDVKEDPLQGVNAVEVKKEENTGLQGMNKKPEEKPLPVNKDTVMRERDKLPEANDKVEVKRKETVWDKLSKQNEERMGALAAGKEAAKSIVASEKLLDEKLKTKLKEVERVPSEGQKESGIRPAGVSDNPVKSSDERKQETKVSELSVGPSQDKVLHNPELQYAKESGKADQNVGSGAPPAPKALVDKPWISPFPASIGSVSITPVQPSKERVLPPGSESIIKNLPASTTITPATKQVPSSPGLAPTVVSEAGLQSPTSKAGPLSPTSKTGPLSPTSRAGPLSPTSKTGPLSPTSKTGPLSPTSKIGPLSPTSRAGPLSPTSKPGPLSPTSKPGPLSPTSKPGPLSPTSKLGPLSPTSKVGSLSVIPVPFTKTEAHVLPVKSGALSPTLVPCGKSGPLSPTLVPSNKSGPLSPSSLALSKSGPLSPSSLPLGKSGSHSSVEVKPSKEGPLSPPSSVISGRVARPVSPSTVPAEKEPNLVQNLPQNKEVEKLSSDSHTVSSSKSQANTVSVAAAIKSLPSAQSAVLPAVVSTHLVQHSKIPPPSSSVNVTSSIPSSSSASSSKTIGFSSNESSAKIQQNKVQVLGDPLKSVSSDKSVALAPGDIIPPFPPVPSKSTHPSTPKDVPPPSSVLSLKSVPPVVPARAAEAIPTPNVRAPPLNSLAPCIPTEAQTETPVPPFPPAPGTFPPVRELTSDDVPSAPVIQVSKDKSVKYFKSPPLLPSSSTYISAPPSKAPPFEQMAPSLPAKSAVLSESFPKVPTAFPAAPVTNKDTPSSGAPKTQSTSSTYFSSPTKFIPSPTIPTPPTRAPTLVKDAVVTEPPQKKAKVEDAKLESQKESPKVPLGGSGRVLNLLKRSHVSSPDEKKEVGGPQEAKVMRKEEPKTSTLSEDMKLERESNVGKTPIFSKNVFPSKEDSMPKTGIGIQPITGAAKPHTAEVKSDTEVKKPSGDPPRRLLKLHNFSREPVKPVVTQPVEKKAESSSKDIPKTESETKNSGVGEAIEEPVMIVKGEGEGAKCESGNDLHYLEGCHSSRPWWECFDNVSNSHNVVDNEDNCETIEENVMYFWGDGNGVDCDAGNNGDETETNAETKQEGSGNSTLVASDNRSNSTSGDIKSQKEKEGGRTDNDLKEIDGVADSDEAKVNGLRTLESEKNLDQLGKTESKGDGKLSGVNGKKSNEDNDIYVEKNIMNKSNKVGEGKNKKDKPHGNDNCENIVSKDVSNKGETVIQRQDSSKTKEENESTVALGHSDSSVKGSEETGREACAKRGTRNRASLEEVRDDSEESEKEELDNTLEDTVIKKKRGRPKGTTIAARGRKPKPARVASQPPSAGEDDEVEEGNDDSPENAKKKRQRGKGSTGRPLPDVPRQRSARIAKIREKEEEERRKLEALRMKQLAEENRLKELKRKAREERRAQRELKKGKREKKEKKDKEKKKRKKKRAKKKTGAGDPWENSSSSSSSSSEEDDIEEEEEDENLEFKSDHEFSPESDIEEADAQPIRRARTAKKAVTKSDVEEEEEEEVEEEEEDQTQCTKCGHDDHPETILLCDNCDAGWHLSCLRPPLLSVPEGDWICPTCEHVVLIKKLKEVLERFDECQKKAHNEELRRQRLAYVNVSLDNILPEGGKKKKKRRLREDGEEEDDDDESGSDSDSDDSDSESDDDSTGSSESSSESDAPLYTLRARSSRTLKEQVEDFDEMINEAIRDEMEAAAGAGNAGRGKDIDNIIQANNEEEEEEVEEGEDEEYKEENEDEVENKENEKPGVEIDRTGESKAEKKEEGDEVKREREADDDEDEVAPKRKKQKASENASENDEDYKESDEHQESDSEEEEEVKPVRKRSKPYNMYFKKRRRLTDLDAEDDDDASDEDFMNTSEEEEEESEESVVSSSSLATEYDSDDSDVIGGKRRHSSRYDSLPLRRSARNRQSAPYEEDSDDERYGRRSKKKKKRRRSSSEEEESSDSDRSYKRKKKVNQRKKQIGKVKGRRGSKKGRGKKQTKSKPRSKKSGEDDGEKPVKPRIKYSKPPKSAEDQEEEVVTQKRVTRGRQVNYYDALLMSDESEEEEPKKKWRGKVMKGERVPTESSEYEASDDERKKRCGVSGGLGRGKVMKGEEEDEEDSRPGSGKKKRGRPKKDELIGKPSPPRPSTIRQTPVMQVSSVPTPTPAPTPTATPTPTPTPIPTPTPTVTQTPPPAPAQAQFLQTTSVTSSPPTVKQATTILPLPVRVKPTDAPKAPASVTPASALPPATVPVTMQPATAYVTAGASPVHRTPEPAVSPSPGAPVTASAPATKVISASVVAASNLGGNSPGHQPQQPIGKWSPHLPGVTITNVSVSSAPGTPPRPNIGSAPGSGTPPRPGLSGPPVTASPPPPYRSSPLPMTSVGRGATPTSTAPAVMSPVGPPNTSSPHSAAYPPYRPPPEHYSPHPGKERFPSHPAFPEYAAPGRHSPSPHGVPPRHPSHIPSGHSLPHLPAGYGPPGPGSYPPGGVPPPHPGVLRGPPHDLYRPPHSHPSHGSPSHPGHPHLVMKAGYPGLEPLPYAGSPGPSPGSIGIHQGSQDSPAHQSPNEDSKDGTLPSSKGPGEFSSGLMSYFSSQRDDDVE